VKNRQYVTNSRQKSINTLGIEEYRRRMAQKQRKYRAKRKALKNANISDRKGRKYDVNYSINVRKESRKERIQVEIIILSYNKNESKFKCK
jgi:hypothetical protein